jgi:hypothetical protein
MLFSENCSGKDFDAYQTSKADNEYKIWHLESRYN